MDTMTLSETMQVARLVFYTSHFVVEIHLNYPRQAVMGRQRFDFEILQPREEEPVDDGVFG